MRTLLALALVAAPLASQTDLTTVRLATGLTDPVWAGAPPGDARIFVVERAGVIKILENGGILPTPFLDHSALVLSDDSEQGMLGLAFDPDFANNGYFYVSYTSGSDAGMSLVSRFEVSAGDPNVADAGSEAVILSEVQPHTNHNGGCLAFGPDGYLYVSFGDGRGPNDPACNAQNLENFLGSILRVDVSAGLPYAIPPDNPFAGDPDPDVKQEIFHYGLRNPWRFSFDQATGEMYIGDVGQDDREEISFQGAGEKGLNFGWKVMEGTRCNLSDNCDPGVPACFAPEYTDPIFELAHNSVPRAVTGGLVYYGSAMPDLVGTYFFADFSDNSILSFEYDPGTGITNFEDRTIELDPGPSLAITLVSSFGVDGSGELLVLDYLDGELYRIIPELDLEITAITPDPLDALVPGTDQVLQIHGNGFLPSATVTISGMQIAPESYTVVNSQLITVDPPQINSLGDHPISVTSGADTVHDSFVGAAPATPKLQLGDGEPLTFVTMSEPLDVIMSGEVGQIHFVFYSESDVPSVHPIVSLDLGNNFTELFFAFSFVIPGKAWVEHSKGFATVPFTILYSQTVALGSGLPAPVSNLQSIIATP